MCRQGCALSILKYKGDDTMQYITNTDSSTLPYNDTDMRYNLTLRQYELTPTGYQNYTGVNLLEYFDSEEEVTAFLVEVSEDVYEYIYSFSLFNMIAIKRWLIAKDDSIREEFKRALITQARASYRSGMHLIKDQHGINIEKSKTILKNDLYSKTIAPRTHSILSRIGLLYNGYQLYTNYEDDGTF